MTGTILYIIPKMHEKCLVIRVLSLNKNKFWIYIYDLTTSKNIVLDSIAGDIYVVVVVAQTSITSGVFSPISHNTLPIYHRFKS